MSVRSWVRRGAGVVLVGGLAGCTLAAGSGQPVAGSGVASGARSGQPPSSPSAAASNPAQAPSPPGPSTSAGASASAVPVQVPPLPQAAPTPVEPALRLANLLAEHSAMANNMMRARIRGDADLAQAADAALGANTKDLGDALAPYLSGSGAATFKDLWAEHVVSLLDYARGYATGDTALREHARRESITYEQEIAALFVKQSQGRLPVEATQQTIHEHAALLLRGADAYAAGKYATAGTGYRQAYSHAYGMGLTLAGALMPEKVTAPLRNPSVRLRSELTRLLGDHYALLLAMSRSATTGPADFASMSQALNANMLEMTAAVDVVFGTEAAKTFRPLWAEQVDQLAAYNTAVVRHDAAAQEQARTALQSARLSLARFLSAATEGRLPPAALVQDFGSRHDEVLAEFGAYTAGSYAQAYALSAWIAESSYVSAQRLAGGISAAAAARLPVGGSQTGGGGAAAAFVEP
jgi:hypothetical protein